jgi:hypothetical protein
LKVFLSWSGEHSHKVAVVLRDWLPSVIQSVEPYVSSEDIDKGARWSTDIAKELESSGYGILCVTRDNVDAPWLNFEAGALSKSVDKGRVSPFLFAIKRSEVKAGPILQFQSTIAEREDVLKLLHSINAASQQGALEETRLNTVFEVWWPQLEKKLNELERTIPAAPAAASAPASQAAEPSEILEEVLELVRQQNRVLNDPTTLLPSVYLESILGPIRDRLDGHPVFEDLSERWVAVREQINRAREKDQPPSEAIFRAIDRLSGPMEYLLEHYSRFPGARRRRRLALPDPPETN